MYKSKLTVTLHTLLSDLISIISGFLLFVCCGSGLKLGNAVSDILLQKKFERYCIALYRILLYFNAFSFIVVYYTYCVIANYIMLDTVI